MLILQTKCVSIAGIWFVKKAMLSKRLLFWEIVIEGLFSKRDLEKLSLVLLKAFRNFSKLSERNVKMGKRASITSAFPTVKTLPCPIFLRSTLQLSLVEM